MVKKIALLIGVGEYATGLKPLRCPANGVAAMRTILEHPEIGGFDEIVDLVNPDVGEMRSRICEVFAQLTKRDLVLFYFTGHGIKDMTGDFYLTTAQTQLFKNGRPNAGTAVAADFLKRELSNCAAQRKVVILDCCFGAAFTEGFLSMSDRRVDVEAKLGGKGWCVLTASTSAGYALEQEGEALSVYTRYLVEGIKTGGAAPDGQDFISARHLHEYVKSQVKVAAPAMEPAIFNGQQGYDIVIAKAQVDNAQRYRKQVQKIVRNGAIGPAGMAVLEQWQQRLTLSPTQAKAIEEEILQPYRERQQHLALYTRALEAEKGFAYPLTEGAIHDLRALQRLLRLRDEDVSDVERQVLGAQLSSPEAKPVQLASQFAEVIEPVKKHRWVCVATVQTNPQGDITQKITCKVKTFTEDLGNGVTLELVHIPETPFWMGKTPITRSQWQASSWVQASQPASRQHSLGDVTASNRPVDNVFWTEAVEYCQWLSQRTGRSYRLPSAAQWEYACRAQTTTPFYFGVTLTSKLANYRASHSSDRQQTTDVGSFIPNAFGLYDTHGNVWEWCLENWPDCFQHLSTDESIHQLTRSQKCLKGGAWNTEPAHCRAAHCFNYPFHDSVDAVGFRVICQ